MESKGEPLNKSTFSVYDPKGVFYFTPDRGFSVLDITLPIYGVVRHSR